MAIKEKHLGKSKTISKNSVSKKESYYGTVAEVDTFVAAQTMNSYVDGKGYLSEISIQDMDGGGMQSVELTFTVETEDQSGSAASSVVGVKSAQMSVRNIQMPLEAHKNYRTNWNYFLIALGDDATLPEWYETATNVIIPVADRKKYRWIQSYSELPTEIDQETSLYWNVLAMPDKPGVSNYDFQCYVVTESAKYNSPNDAGNAISKTINTITPPETTFNITGGNWKHDEASVSYDGKRWIATSTYTHSGDSAGWDSELYS